MAKKFKKVLSAFLAVLMCVSTMSNVAYAAETLENGNIWNGKEVKVDVAAGKDAYTFMTVFQKPHHAYEISNHYVGNKDLGIQEGPQTFVVIDTLAHDGTTWTPDGVYESGKSNYELTYCCDITTGIKGGTYYKRVNLEDSEYYSEDAAANIRAIVTNSYPFVSLETMKEELAEEGFENADALTRSDVISAVQAAIWTYANDADLKEGDLTYLQSFNPSKNSQWGGIMHDYSAEMSPALQSLGNRQFATDADAEARINALIPHLLDRTEMRPTKKQIVISSLDVAKPTVNAEGVHEATVKVNLNNSGSSDQDNIVLNIYVNDKVVKEQKIEIGKEYYEFTVALEPGQTVKAVVSGTQVLPTGVYFYAAKPSDVDGDGIATSRETSQNLVGVAAGETPVYAEASKTVEVAPKLGTKESERLESEDNRYNVTIDVPGQDGDTRHDEVILMVDGSYSMDNEWPAMKEAINTIGETVLNGSGSTQLTLMAFGMGDNEVLVHVKDAAELAAALGELPGNLLYGRSSTNCEAGFTGVAEYIENHDESLKDVHVIFISDGNVNTDETPRAFDANWQTWTKFGALTVAQAAFRGTVSNGENLPAAFTTVFGDRFDGATKEEIITRAFGGEVTDEEFIAFAEQLWTDVYAYSGLKRGEAYPVSDAERAFVKYDKENGTYIQDLFYYTTYKSAYVTYGDCWTRTPAAANKLVAMDEVKSMYVVDYDGYTAWMDTGITSEKSTFVQSNGIAGLCEALAGAMKELAKTPFNNVVVTDYMSKWVNLDADTLKIIDNNSGETIWTAADGWLISENRPTAQDVPVVVELIDSADYGDGGEDVLGNTNGDIYKLTWYVKDGAMLRADNYRLAYEVTVDTAEEGFEYSNDYPANGNTDLWYTDENDNESGNEIKVPSVNAEEPEIEDITISFNNGEASNISFMLIDKTTGKVEFLKKIDIGNETSFVIPSEPGKVSAVFVKQSTSGMFWFSEEVDEDTVNATIECLKANNPSYKGHNAVAFGAGEHELEFKKNKFVTYTFAGCDAVVKDEVIEESTPDTNVDSSEEPTLNVAVTGAEITSWTIEGDVTAIYIAANGKVPAVIWTSKEVGTEDMATIRNALGADADAKTVFGSGTHTIEYKHNKNKTKTVSYTFEIAE